MSLVGSWSAKLKTGGPRGEAPWEAGGFGGLQAPSQFLKKQFGWPEIVKLNLGVWGRGSGDVTDVKSFAITSYPLGLMHPRR